MFKLTQQTTNEQGVPLPVEDVTELHFTQLPLVPASLFTPFHCLRKLSLVSLKPALKQFWDLPLYYFPVLEKLDLSDNKIERFTSVALSATNPPSTAVVGTDASIAWNACTSSHKQSTSALPIASLKRLHLINNVIDDVQQLTALSLIFPNLEVLDIAENPVAATFARSEAFALLWPNTLSALDSVDKEGEVIEVLETDDDEEDSDDDEEEDEDDEEEDEECDEPVKKAARTES